jgi:hypothetical protein
MIGPNLGETSPKRREASERKALTEEDKMIKELKTKLAREPFRSFVIELASGRQIVINQETELLFPRRHPERVIAFTEDGLQHEFDEVAIISLIEL